MKFGIFSKIKGYLTKDNFSLERKIYYIFLASSILLSLATSIWDTVNLGVNWGVIVRFVYVFLAFSFFFLPPYLKNKLIKPLILIINFIYIPVLYFPSNGSNGAYLLFAMIGLFMVMVTFRGYKRIFFAVLNISIYVAFAILEFYFPEWATPFNSETAKLLDLIVAIILSFAGFAFIAAFIADAFCKEQRNIFSLMNELEQKNEKLSDLSVRDSLTGTYNRRYLTEYINNELEICKKSNSHFYILMMDLDFFKNINDQYGHAAGDVVLVEFAKIVQVNIRLKDVLARYGGEEFVSILKIKDISSAVEIAERIRKAVENLKFDEGFKITVSIGVAKSEVYDTCDSVISRADILMYSAKNSGRNKVVF